MIDLKIQYQECDSCGAMVYPHNLISSKGEKIKIEKFVLQADADKTRKDIILNDITVKESDYKKNSKGLKRTETETEVSLEIERYLAVLEGDENNGRQKCPICGFVLASWSK